MVCNAVTGELQASTSNLDKILTLLHFTFLSYFYFTYFSLVFLYVSLYVSAFSSFPLHHSPLLYFLSLLSVLINMLLYGCH